MKNMIQRFKALEKLSFKNKEEYLAWRQQWKEDYSYISEAIRILVEAMRRYQAVGPKQVYNHEKLAWEKVGGSANPHELSLFEAADKIKKIEAEGATLYDNWYHHRERFRYFANIYLIMLEKAKEKAGIQYNEQRELSPV
jgi:hypothetical protein